MTALMKKDDLVGAWELMRWTSLKNGTPDGYPMGEDAKGQIIYSSDGRMSGFLMRKDFKSEATGTPARHDTSLAYGGTYHIDGDQVIHDVLYATIPHWIGGPLIRTLDPQENGELLLKTAPEFSKSGSAYEHHLLWRRVAKTGEQGS